MTIREALVSFFGDVTVIDTVLIERNLIPSDEYSSLNTSDVEIARAFILKYLYTNFDFSEGKLSIKYSRSAMAIEANRIFKKYQLLDEIIGGQKTIKSPNVW